MFHNSFPFCYFPYLSKQLSNTLSPINKYKLKLGGRNLSILYDSAIYNCLIVSYVCSKYKNRFVSMRENYKPESIKCKSYCEIYENKIAKIMSLE